MSTVTEPEFDFSKYSYPIHHQRFEIEKTDKPTNADDAAANLLKETKELPEKISPKNLYDIVKLTERLITLLPDPNKDRFFTIFRSNTPRDHLIALQKKLTLHLKAIETAWLDKMNAAIQEKSIDYFKIKRRLEKASPSLLQTDSFRKAKQLFIEKFFKDNVNKSAEDLAVEFADILSIDHELSWLQEYSKKQLPNWQIQLIIAAIGKLHARMLEIKYPKTKNQLVLFEHTFLCLQENGIDPQNSLQGACQLLAIIQSRSSWQELFAHFDTRVAICLLKELACMVEKDSFYKEIFKNGIADLIEPKPALKARYKQLQGVPSEKSMLSDVDMLEIAYFIETNFNSSCNFIHGHFKKGSYPLPASLQRDGQSGDVYVLLSRKKITFFKSTPGSKKVPRATIRLAHHPYEKAEFFCQTVNPTWIEGEDSEKKKQLKRLTDESTRSQLVKEATLQQSLRGIRGIWPLFTFCEYQKMLGQTEVSKVSIMSPLGTTIKDAMYFDLKTKLSLMLDLTCGLSYLHSKKYMQGDVKPGNALIGKDEKGDYFAGLIDYGFTEEINSNVEPIPLAMGLYGTRHYTAPELFGEQHKKLDCYKLDVWALGNLFYLLITCDDPPWKNEVFNTKTKMTTAQTRSSLKENISKNIEAALQKLVQKKKLTIEEQCTQLVYNTLRLVPEQRWNIDQIARELKRILAAT